MPEGEKYAETTLGVRFFYDFDLIRTNIFQYQLTQDFPSYIKNVAEFSNSSMSKDVGYYLRPIRILQPFLIDTSHFISFDKLFLKCTVIFWNLTPRLKARSQKTTQMAW